MGWEEGTFLKSIPAYFEDGEYIFNAKAFDPRNKVDHAFMGVEPTFQFIKNDDYAIEFELSWDGYNWVALFYGHGQITCSTPNEAIMLMCLKAKGVVE